VYYYVQILYKCGEGGLKLTEEREVRGRQDECSWEIQKYMVRENIREKKDNEKKREGLTTDKREMEKGRRAYLE
jgi:hypothetical protein